MRLLGDKGLLRGLLAAMNLVGVRDRNNERDDSDTKHVQCILVAKK